MASPPFPGEDHTDEDFFDKLVEDEDEGDGSVLSSVENVESDDTRPFAEIRVRELDSAGAGFDSTSRVERGVGEKGAREDVISSSLEGNVENMRAEEIGFPESSQSSDSTSGVESGDQAVGSAGECDLFMNSVNVGTGVREVQWSSFTSYSPFNDGTGDRSYPEFLNENDLDLVVPFGEVTDSSVVESNSTNGFLSNVAGNSSSYSYVQHDETQKQGLSCEHAKEVLDLNNSQYWENLYPGWRYDLSSGQWHQLDSSDVIANTEEACNGHVESAVGGVISDQLSDAYYLQQKAQSVIGGVTEGVTSSNVSYSNQVSQASVEYPTYMLFDPQYPGWYYDTIAQEWRLLESYAAPRDQLVSAAHGQHIQNGNVSTGTYYSLTNCTGHGQSDQVDNCHQYKDQLDHWGGSVNNFREQNIIQWQPGSLAKNEAVNVTESVQFDCSNLSSAHVNGSSDFRAAVAASRTTTLNEQMSWCLDNSNGSTEFQSFAPAENSLQNRNEHYREMNHQMQYSAAHFNAPNLLNVLQQPLQSASPFSGVPSEGRSSDGRPLHALVTFGFGGKLIVMKDHNSFLTKASYGSQDSATGVINVLNIMEVVLPTSDGSRMGLGASSYVHTLCQQFPGPLASGNVGSKELNKWIEDKVENSATLDGDYKRGEVLRMLFSLLKVACQYYGKLRSPFGTDHVLMESDHPESALAKLFASAKSNDTQFTEDISFTQCLQNLPSEGQIQATALEFQKLLVSGRRIEALQCAQEGQLWGPAIVIAAQLGDQFYGDTVKQMAVRQLIAGCPLRTLCLLIAGQPAEVFSSYKNDINQSNALNASQLAQVGAKYVLDEWESNLAIITSNRTKGDELVITHLGDCLWKEKGEVAAAHICYLVAEANIEPYSDSARLCLIGADHWKYPRTYASPDAIQRTEVYEYAKVLGNSQFVLLPFQPYKLIYAYMLAEVGKLSDSLKYCQAILKSLKTGRAPEVDAWKHLVSSLEERIKIHQQGGNATNMAPAKLVGKLFNLFDSTAHRVVGRLPPSALSVSHSNGQYKELDHQSIGARVYASQSTMAMSSLVPSASCEPINEWAGGSSFKSMHSRSISEPDIGRIPRKVDSPEQSSSSDSQGSTVVPRGSSRFGRFGSQLFQKTVGLVLRSHSDRQAKLGETNRFYYDEKLKRWVEEGAEPPTEEAALAPPPTAGAFMNGIHKNMKDESRNGILHANGELDFKSPNYTEKSSGIPPIPPGSNQFSARGRMGVRARYVDTFNRGSGSPTNLFQSPSAPATKPASGGAKIFIPTPLPEGDYHLQAADTVQEAVVAPDDKTNSSLPPQEMPTSSSTMQQYPSIDNIMNGRVAMVAIGNGSIHLHSRQTASWSGGLGDSTEYANTAEIKPPPVHTSGEHSSTQISANVTAVGDDLQEVEL
ncbi:hypothetical protein Nepgr_002454 [Nepenthes gracilis]|uniref:Protein transport protein sec16 n=1 Tax=Nepenthes gracilis TaxID=150966 RepID=A0AAD3P3U8_NEPGR|nr:hypothetical protein Nepgr_002454 [Nepenthes gracilis]